MDNSTAGRKYDSPLREARAAKTRQRIVDAVFEVLGGGVAELTMPAIAKVAGVSLPTVYRYFPDKPALLDAAADSARDRLGVRFDPAPDLPSFLQRVRDVGERLRDATDVLRVLAAVSVEGPYDLEAQAARHDGVASTLRQELRGISGRDRKLAVDWVMMLSSSPMAGVLARFNFAGDERTERIVWAIETLLLGVQARKERSKTTKTEEKKGRKAQGGKCD